MKNIFFLAFFVVIFVIVPAFALDLDLSGHYVAEHFSHSNETLNKNDVTDSYSSMELMLRPILKINDNIKLTIEFTALQDHVWGTNSQPIFQTDNPLLPAINSGNNIDWKAAYLTLRTSIGGFLIGRGIEKRWGTGLGDSTGSHGGNSKHKDGILWVVPIGNSISGLGWQHISEDDKGFLVSDSDFDKTYLFSAYKKENWHAGLLLARYDHKNFVVMEELRIFQKGYAEYKNRLAEYLKTSAIFGFAHDASKRLEAKGSYEEEGLTKKAKKEGYSSVTRWELEKPGSQVYEATDGRLKTPDLHELMILAQITQGAAIRAGAKVKNGPGRSILGLWVLDPYIIGDFGPFRVEAELLYGWGSIDLDSLKNVGLDDFSTLEVEGLAGNIGFWREFDGGFNLGIGAAYCQGDASAYEDGEFSAIGYLEQSIDFERGFLFTSDEAATGDLLGGISEEGIALGNLASGPLTISGASGYTMFWIEAKYAIFNNVDVGFLCVSSHADEPPNDWDNDHGVEYDFTLKWEIMDNLVFNGTLAYLDAGDFWKAGNDNREIDNNTTLHGKLTVKF